MGSVRQDVIQLHDAWLAAIVQSSSDAIVGKTLDGTIISWNPAAEKLFGYTAEEAVGRNVFMLAPPGREDELPGILEQIRRGQRVERFETVRRHKNGRIIPVSLTISPVRDATGRIIGASKIARDITERKAMEERLRILNAEIEHRSRNQLTLVCSMLRLTRAASIEDFKSVVTHRILALQRATDQLYRNEWRGADLRELLMDGLAAFEATEDRVSLDGPAALVAADGVRALAMAVHELATNAARYGALSAPGGRVEIRWRLGAEPSGDLLLDWTERGGPPAKKPERSGLGLGVIELSVTKELHGKLSQDWSEAGLRCTMTLPARLFVIEDNGGTGEDRTR